MSLLRLAAHRLYDKQVFVLFQLIAVILFNSAISQRMTLLESCHTVVILWIISFLFFLSIFSFYSCLWHQNVMVLIELECVLLFIVVSTALDICSLCSLTSLVCVCVCVLYVCVYVFGQWADASHLYGGAGRPYPPRVSCWLGESKALVFRPRL